MIKKLGLLGVALAALLSLPATAPAEPHNYGVGVYVGPTYHHHHWRHHYRHGYYDRWGYWHAYR
jgi:hypothetical protein